MKNPPRMERFWWGSLEVPVGLVVVVGTAEQLLEIGLLPPGSSVRAWLASRYPTCAPAGEGPVPLALRQLAEYFQGRRRRFEVPLAAERCSDFGQRVLEALSQVPYAERISYGELARLAGSPGAARAVGRVMAGNRWPIVVPCHRVVGAGGRLTGYSGGTGLDCKQWLLDFEAEVAAREI